MKRRGLAFLLLFSFLAPLNCRKAEGVAADPGEREAEEALVAYIRIDTSNPPGNETAAAQFLAQLLQKSGVAAQLVGSNPSRQSVYARLQSGSNEPALLLLHHIDVVPANASEWTKPPFSGTRSGGYIWGRGAIDDKSLGIAQLMAFLELKRRNVKLRRDVIFLGVADEETGGAKGAAELLEQHPELFTNVGFVLNEGGANETAVDKILFWGIEFQQKVPLWLRLHVKGAGGHAASPPADGGATAKLIRALAAIDRIETPYRLEANVARSFALLGKARTDARGAQFRAIKAPLDVTKLPSEFGAGFRALLHDTITITSVNAGSSVNVLPTSATADLDIRLLPDSSPQEMVARIKAAAGKDVEVQTLVYTPATAPSPIDSELVATMMSVMRAAEPGSAAGPIVITGTSDSRFFRARGIAAYGMSPFKVNYYDADGVHAADERIRSRFFAEGVRVMRSIVHDFCVVKRHAS